MRLFTCKNLFSFMILGVLAFAVPAQAADSFNAAQKDEIGAVVKQYLNDHPDVIIDALNKHRDELAADQQKADDAKLESHLAALTSDKMPSAGNPKGDVTAIEFFDYNCGYCKRAYPDMTKAVSDDKNLRFVFVDMPILGPTSLTAAQWALAAQKQGKYFEFHKAVMEHNGPKDEDNLSTIAKGLGLDVDKMKKDAASDDVQKQIADNLSIARDLGIDGTPGFIINKTIARGYMGPDGLQKAIEAEHEKAKK